MITVNKMEARNMLFICVMVATTIMAHSVNGDENHHLIHDCLGSPRRNTALRILKEHISQREGHGTATVGWFISNTAIYISTGIACILVLLLGSCLSRRTSQASTNYNSQPMQSQSNAVVHHRENPMRQSVAQQQMFPSGDAQDTNDLKQSIVHSVVEETKTEVLSNQHSSNVHPKSMVNSTNLSVTNCHFPELARRPRIRSSSEKIADSLEQNSESLEMNDTNQRDQIAHRDEQDHADTIEKKNDFTEHVMQKTCNRNQSANSVISMSTKQIQSDSVNISNVASHTQSEEHDNVSDIHTTVHDGHSAVYGRHAFTPDARSISADPRSSHLLRLSTAEATIANSGLSKKVDIMRKIRSVSVDTQQGDNTSRSGTTIHNRVDQLRKEFPYVRACVTSPTGEKTMIHFPAVKPAPPAGDVHQSMK